MGQEILKRKDYYWEIGSHKNLVTITLLNIWETCLHRDALTVALFYMEKIEPLLNDETDLYKRTIYLFCQDFYTTSKEKNNLELRK